MSLKIIPSLGKLGTFLIWDSKGCIKSSGNSLKDSVNLYFSREKINH
jgi:hypothetical protein